MNAALSEPLCLVGCSDLMKIGFLRSLACWIGYSVSSSIFSDFCPLTHETREILVFHLLKMRMKVGIGPLRYIMMITCC